MIQRKQTLFLLLGCMINFALFLCPIGFIHQANSEPLPIAFLDFIHFISWHNFAGLIIFILLESLIIITILVFNNRSVQISLGYLTIVGQLLFVIITGLKLYEIHPVLKDIQQLKVNQLTIIHVAVIILFILAIRYIKKDEELVKSTNRIR